MKFYIETLFVGCCCCCFCLYCYSIFHSFFSRFSLLSLCFFFFTFYLFSYSSTTDWSLIFFFYFTEICNIPDEIRHLQRLHTLDFSSNDIDILPLGILQLKNLTILGLNDLSLTALPDDFGK